MSEIVVIVEGETEHDFVNRQLQRHLLKWSMFTKPTLPGKNFKRGGVRRWQAIKDDIIRTLKERPGRHCTTMFDFYAMPHDWPGRTVATTRPWHERGEIIERAIHADIVNAMGSNFNAERFIPYVQIHEFEALLFSDEETLATEICLYDQKEIGKIEQQIISILAQFPSPEAINDGRETAPSKRLLSLAPYYNKRVSGARIIENIGLEKVRQKCAHFNQWITRLETAAQSCVNQAAQ
jgi:hypothetical protein